MLTRLMNAPDLLQRASALMLLALALALSLAVGATGQNYLQSRRAEVLVLRERAGQMMQIIALKDTLKVPINNMDDTPLFVEAGSPTIGRATLQGRIEAVALSNGLQISSAGALPDSREGRLMLVGQRVDLSGGYDAIQSALLELETSRPPMLVREFAIRLISGEAGDRPIELAAQIKVYSALRLGGTDGGSTAAKAETPP